jgi:hypothetical protein
MLWLAVLMSKVTTPQLAAGAGHLGVSAGSLALMLTHHASMELVLTICGAGVLLAITAAAVTIIEVRTNRTVESRRMAALIKIARKLPNKDRAIRLLLAEPLIANGKQLSSKESCRLVAEEQRDAREHGNSPPASLTLPATRGNAAKDT